MTRPLVLLFGIVGYAVSLATLLYLIGFVTGFVVPTSLDVGAAGLPPLQSALVNLGLVALFGVQHWVMARPGFKTAIAGVIPPSIERTVYLFATCAVLGLTFWAWQPMPTVLWRIDGAAAWVVHGVGFLGWTIALLSTFLIDHFDLFGLRQTWLSFRGLPYTKKPFVERSLYRFVRHPLMLGFLTAFWAAPVMTVGHLVFAGGFTAYVLAALFVEERDLVARHGAAYLEYRRRVPKLIPVGRRSVDARATDAV